MKRIEALVIGGGQAGLAMSRSLTRNGVEHVVLERGRVGERWRSERWESLRLLTPRWQSRLPGHVHRGGDPDGFMARDEVVALLEDYARSFAAPLESGVTVTRVAREDAGFRVATDHGEWHAANVVIATGHCDVPYVPPVAAKLAPAIAQVTPSRYRHADALPEGGVLVVGASATGVQLAAEIHRSGRPVTLAVGRHNRLPRRYRGRDIMGWLDAIGVLREGLGRVNDPRSSRQSPSFQLVGSDDHRTLDLGVLMEMGVRLTGRLAAVAGERAWFGGDLEDSIDAADERLRRLLARVDEHIAQLGLQAPPGEPMVPIVAPGAPRALDFASAGIRTVLWATGYRRDYSWLDVPVLDPQGEIVQAGGLTPVPGLYVLGLQFQRRRNSSFLDGVGADAVELARHIAYRATRRLEPAA